ncbi:MAG: amino acid ABC transporter permease [Alphaproteobacteria bacterium]|nr:amino acid ABC transporter permease [Alphaproteobacteria bacterium]
MAAATSHRTDLASWAKFAAFAAVVIGGVVYGASRMSYAWKWEQVPRFIVRVIDGAIYPGPLLKGLAVTLEVSAVSFLVALAIGLAAALCRLSDSIVARGLARVYLEAVRNTPLLVQIYLLYFVLAPILNFDRWFAAVFALAVFEGAFAAEIFRGGILSVPRGQTEAAMSLGLGRGLTYRLVVVPQAIRIMLPPLTSLAVSLVKHSAIVSAIAMFDLFNEARTVVSETFLSYEIYLTTGAIYLAVTLALSLLVTRLERRFARAG